MQTFLPYSRIEDTMAVLDRQRLGKQRVEALQLVQCLGGETDAWLRHPCAQMWIGHGGFLVYYGLAACLEWRRRGYRDTTMQKLLDRVDLFPLNTFSAPPWLGVHAFHLSHKQNLVRKDPDYYGTYWPGVQPAWEYIWPTKGRKIDVKA